MSVEVLALAERRLRQLRRSPGRLLGVALRQDGRDPAAT